MKKLRRYRIADLDAKTRAALCQRPAQSLADLIDTIRPMFEAVDRNGDEALRELTRKFDSVELGSKILVGEEELAAAEKAISADSREAIRYAAENIAKFHRAQLAPSSEVETAPGVRCRREWRPIERVGLYVPGGKAPLVSTVLMLAVPAKIAGCRDITLCTPPGRANGTIVPEVLFAAHVAGVKRVARVGGAQAIAAMALGTASVPRADKLFGPGNRYVTAAKAYASQLGTAIDMQAGPSELLIIADESARPEWIAADLLSQAEHGADSQVVLVSLSESLIERVGAEIECQIEKLGSSMDLADLESSLAHSYVVLASSKEEALAFSNDYAPEHLNLAVSNPESWTAGVTHAGSVFVGANCSVVFGDYASGTNHTLPTAGTARSSGGLTIESFLKPVLFQSVTEKGLPGLVSQVTHLARIEGLEAHARASELRVKP